MNKPTKFAGSRSTNQLEMRTVITNQKTVMNRSLSAGSRLNPSMQFLQDARRELHKQVRASAAAARAPVVAPSTANATPDA